MRKDRKTFFDFDRVARNVTSKTIQSTKDKIMKKFLETYKLKPYAPKTHESFIPLVTNSPKTLKMSAIDKKSTIKNNVIINPYLFQDSPKIIPRPSTPSFDITKHKEYFLNKFWFNTHTNQIEEIPKGFWLNPATQDVEKIPKGFWFNTTTQDVEEIPRGFWFNHKTQGLEKIHDKQMRKNNYIESVKKASQRGGRKYRNKSRKFRR